MRPLHRISALFLVLLAGCMGDNNVTSSTGPLVFTLSADSAWSGGSVSVTATRFAELAYPPVFVSGTDTVTATRVGDSTYTLRIPIGAAGPVPIAIQEGTRRFEVGTVERAGFREVQWYTPGFDFSMQVQARRHGVPVVLGNGPSGITLAYPSLHRSERITGLRAPDSYYGIGQSFRGDEFVLRDSTGAVGIWELWPAPRLRTPWPSSRSRARQGTVMSPTTFLEVFSHWTQTMDTTSPARGFGPFDTEDCWNVHLSPRGDRVVLRSVASNAGVPVINSLTGDTAYTIPRMRSLGAAGFTADGSEFFASGYYPPSDSLRRIDATTGAILASAALPGAGPWNLEVDPGGRYVYLHLNADCRPRIVVYDATTMAMVGDLRVPLSVDPMRCDNSTWEGMLVLDTAPNRLYVVWNGEPFPVFEFTVLP